MMLYWSIYIDTLGFKPIRVKLGSLANTCPRLIKNTRRMSASVIESTCFLVRPRCIQDVSGYPNMHMRSDPIPMHISPSSVIPSRII
jgi:hypothetical protein